MKKCENELFITMSSLYDTESCRTCLSRNGELTSVFGTYEEKPVVIRIRDVLTLCASVQISEGDGLPDKICRHCLEEMERAYIFRTLCESSNALLRDNVKLKNKSKSTESSNSHFNSLQDNNEGESTDDLAEDTDVELKKPDGKPKTNSYTCRECKKKYMSLTSLDVHVRLRHKDPFGCKKCGKSFVSNSYLDKHTENCAGILNGALKGDELKLVSIPEKKRTFPLLLRNETKPKNSNFGSKTNDHSKNDDNTKLSVPVNKGAKFVRDDSNFGTNANDRSENENPLGFVENEQFKGTNEMLKLLDASKNDNKSVGVQEKNPEYVKVFKDANSLLELLDTSKNNDVINIRGTNQMDFKDDNDQIDEVKSDFDLKSLKEKHSTGFGNVQKVGEDIDTKKSASLETPIPCKFCSRHYNTEADLVRHVQRIHEEGKRKRIFLCNICGRILISHTSFKNHMTMHTNLRPHKCDMCDKGFNHPTSLLSHRRVHTGERPYKCPICDQRFRQAGDRNVHVKKHPGEKLHHCRLCDRGFMTRLGMVSHIRVKHVNDRPFKCSMCEKSFAEKGPLRVHLKNHLGLRPFVCSLCGSGFKRNYHLVTHMKVHEGKK